jgi:hypothetical protein
MDAARFPDCFLEAVRGIWSRIPLFWRFQICGWGAFFVLTFPVKLHLSGSISASLGSFFVRDGFTFSLTLLLRKIYDRVYERHRNPAWIVGTIVFSSATGALLQIPVYFLVGRIFPFEERTIFGQSALVGIFYYRLGLFVCWSLLYFGIRQMLDGIKRDLRLLSIESEKRGAELQLLRAQMNPHFLFNALNTIQAGICRKDSQLAGLVQSFSQYLRYSLENRDSDHVPLGNEFDAIASYLAVEKARFQEKLEIECSINPDTRNTLVPGIMIQPLVENAIKYGRKTSPRPLKIRVNISNIDSDGVQIEVSNTGKWIEPNPVNTLGGVGLENLNARLNLLYHDTHCFRISSENGWVTARIRIPKTP